MKLLYTQDTPPTPSPLPAPRFARKYLHAYCTSSFNEMHQRSMAQYDVNAQDTPTLRTRQGTRTVVIAPRGAAKSTIHSLLIPLMDIVYGREKYIVIVSATLSQASIRLRAIQRELLCNVQLREDFWITQESITVCNRRVLEINGVRIEAFGVGSEMRGISHEGFRPSRIILDDAENSRLAGDAVGRAALLVWYDEVVENLGDTYTHIDVVGTLLHRDSLVATLMGRGDFRGSAWRSVACWARNQGLWEEWKRIRSDLENENRLADSEAFYREHEEEMLVGTRVLWPEKESYLDLQKLMLRVGRRAFSKEKQNVPLNEDWHIFDWTQFKKFDLKGDHITASPAIAPDSLSDPSVAPTNPNLSGLQIFGFLDPATGTSQAAKRGDFASIVTVGRDRAGFYYVLDVWMERTSVARQVDKIFELNARYKYKAFGYEANGFQRVAQEMIEAKQKGLRAAGRPAEEWQIPLIPVTHSANKVARIQALEPQIESGWIQFLTELPDAFVEQVESFPTARHDDGLDALAGCIEMARKRVGGPVQITLAGRPRVGDDVGRGRVASL